MKIIDKNKDYYDFYQNIYRDDTFTFDRRDSYVLSKEEFMRKIFLQRFCGGYETEEDILLQVCNTFWLFKMVVTKHGRFGDVQDYELNLVATWKDYSKKEELIKLSHIYVDRFVFNGRRRGCANEVENKVYAIKHNQFRYEREFNEFRLYRDDKTEVRHIPILQNIGIASEVNPLDIYLALEEYFAKQVTNNERTESVGLTDEEKVENHGFDKKVSFRGK